MNRYYYDLHVHSCLSPCGDDDNTPNNLAGMATLNNINIMAICDHNTSKNCPAFFEAAARYGIIPIPGMELTTAEDIHIVCLFPCLDECMAFDEEINSRRILIKNKVDIFGRQIICDGDDNPIGEEEYLLPNATTVSLDEVPQIVDKYNGVCYPAHIDRPANGIIETLGFMPPYPVFNCYELYDLNKKAEYEEKYSLKDKLMVCSSDAHYLTSLREENSYFDLEDEPYSSDYVRRQLINKLKGGI